MWVAHEEDWFLLLEARAWMELASLLMALTRPSMPCRLISVLDSSSLSLLSWRPTRSLCRRSSLSSQAWSASAMMEALLEIAVPTSHGSWRSSPSAPPRSSPLLRLLAGESECSLGSDSARFWKKENYV